MPAAIGMSQPITRSIPRSRGNGVLFITFLLDDAPDEDEDMDEDVIALVAADAISL